MSLPLSLILVIIYMLKTSYRTLCSVGLRNSTGPNRSSGTSDNWVQTSENSVLVAKWWNETKLVKFRWVDLNWNLYITAMSHDRHGISNYWSVECLFNSLFRLTTKKHQRSALISLCEGNPLVTGCSLHKGAVMRKMFPFDDAIMVWLTSRSRGAYWQC